MSDAAFDFRGSMTILRRTGSFDWSLVGLDAAAGSLADSLLLDAKKAEGSAAAFAAMARRIGPAQPGPDPGPLAFAPWVAASGGALSRCDKVQQVSGERPETLVDLSSRDAILRTIAHYAGRAKDGAMDARLCLGAFGWWLVRYLVAGLRADVEGKDRAEAERILAPFAPMLVLLGRVMEEREASRDKTSAAVEKATAEVQDAAAERDAAEAQLKLRGEPQLPRDTLLELARSSDKRAEGAPPPANRGRSRRR